MKIADYLDAKLCWVMDAPASGVELLKVLSERIAEAVEAVEAGPLLEALEAREATSSTATPEGVALPHAMLEGLSESFLAAVRLTGPVDCAGRGVDLVFVLVGPPTQAWEHVRLLARLARICHGSGALESLRGAGDGADLHQRLLEEDQRHV